MAYRFQFDDRSVEAGLRRIALDQIDRALAEIDDPALEPHATVHQVRKRCKKLRGLVRLVRPAFGGYKAENAAARDAARALSGLRDTEALIEAYDALVARYGEEVDRRAFAPVRRRLTLRQQEAADGADVERALAAVRDDMAAARERAAGWRLDEVENGFDALAGGLAKTYRRARKAMAGAREAPTEETVHEWRKRAKYHWYHARLLAPMWPGPMRAHRDAAKRLSDMLGDHHDLAVLRRTVAGDRAAFGPAAAVTRFERLAARRQGELEAEGFALGARLLAEPPKALARRWGAYWNAWGAEAAQDAASAAA